MTTPVIFRKFKSLVEDKNDVIALFPTIPSDSGNYYNVQSYEHTGQHGGASPDIVQSTLPAKPSEYEYLLAELKSIGYDDLKVVQRMTYAYQKERERVWREQMGRPDPWANKGATKKKLTTKKRTGKSSQTSLGGMRG